MRRAPLVLIILALALLVGPVAHASTPAAMATAPASPTAVTSPTAQASKETTEEATARAGRSVLAITSADKRVGSGVVVAPNMVLTSLDILEADRAALMINDSFVYFRVVTTDKNLKLALLSAQLPPDIKPIAWGDSASLRAGDPVVALGIPQTIRDVIRIEGHVKASAVGMGNKALTTDIPIDPLVEGGALVTPDGKAVGIIVSQGFRVGIERLGVAVTSDQARALVESITKAREREEAEAAARARWKWVPRLTMLAIVGAFIGFFMWFGRWYRRMEEREAAKERATQGSRAAASSSS